MPAFPSLLPASSEFIKLCQRQLRLLAQGIGAHWAVVYLAQPNPESLEMCLTPISIYSQKSLSSAPNSFMTMVDWPQTDGGALGEVTAISDQEEDQDTRQDADAHFWEELTTAFPLLHEELILGFLATGREDRPWRSPDLAQIDLVVQSLVFACVLDQQKSWATERLSQQQHLQELEQEHFQDLLHQLRNPTTAIGTFGKLLLKRFAETDRNYAVAQSIVRESDRLKLLLGQFGEEISLTEAQIKSLQASSTLALPANIDRFTAEIDASSQTLELELEILDLATVLLPIVQSMVAIAAAKNITLHQQIPADLPAIWSNQNALTEIVTNLLENAIKYTPQNGEIFLHVEPGSTEMIIAVHDTGCGIPPEDLPRIFERHYRGIQAQGDIYGTGLGLAIAKELAKKIHGDITADSPNLELDHSVEYPGTTFSLSVPLA